MVREIFNPEKKEWVPFENELKTLEQKKIVGRGLTKEEESRLETLREEEKFLKNEERSPKEPPTGQYL